MCTYSSQRSRKGPGTKFKPLFASHYTLFKSQNGTTTTQKLENNANTKPMTRGPTEMDNPREPDKPGDGAGACSYAPGVTVGGTADDPIIKIKQYD